MRESDASLAQCQRLQARLRQRMERLYPLQDFALTIPGAPTPYSIALPADPYAPLDRLAEEMAAGHAPTPSEPVGDAAAVARQSLASGTHLPYWALLWPSGMALAEALLARPEVVRRRRVLELGCGLGVTAIAALACGAELCVSDVFAEALLFCRYNTLRNAGRTPRTLPASWRTHVGRDACRALGPFDVVLAADVLYEDEDREPLAQWAPRLLAPQGVFWLAEPGRRASGAFVAERRAAGWRDETTLYERTWPPEDKSVAVTVHRFDGLAAQDGTWDGSDRGPAAKPRGYPKR
ncbi:MAG TPA: methyltransferase domain-containing protein [Ktedonobacterales bacterium]|nr:methyltransferase domain-containing protein [Ktedonobacterales bacterium]